MSRIVVTGGGGFLGNAFVVALRRRFPDAEIVPLDVRPGPGVRVADILDRAALDALLPGTDLLVHTAAVVEESGAVDVMWRGNVGGASTVLAAGAGARRYFRSAPARPHAALPDQRRRCCTCPASWCTGRPSRTGWTRPGRCGCRATPTPTRRWPRNIKHSSRQPAGCRSRSCDRGTSTARAARPG